MHLWTRVSIGSLVAIAAASAGWLALHHRDAAATKRQIVSEEALHGPPDSEQVSDPVPPDERFVAIEAVDFSAVPAAYVEKVSAENTEELAGLVEDWLINDRRVPISYRRGLIYVESAEDRGDDGPYPRSAEPEAIHACGSQALWLRSYIKSQLSYLDHVSCSQNICSYGGMEYAPNGELIFHLRVDGEWELRGWVLNYQATLGEAERKANSASVRDGLMRLRNATCKGEPDGQY